MGKVWTDIKIQQLIELLKNSNLSLADIAKQCNTTYDAITNAMKRYGLSHCRVRTQPKITTFAMEKLVTELDDSKFIQAKLNAKTKWILPKSKKPKKTKNPPYEIYLVAGDIHIPEHDEIALKSIFKLMDDIKFNGNILLGDIMDLSVISHWNENKRRTLEGKRLKEDYIIGNVILDEFDKRLPKNCDKRFFYGNHELWEKSLVEKLPSLEGLFNPTTELHLKERGYIVYENENHIERINQLDFTHGLYTSVNYVQKHLIELKTNILFAHLHSQRERYSSSAARKLSMAGYCLGCLCHKSPDFMKNRPNRWTSGFGVVYFYPDGYFDVKLIRIINGRFIFDGKVYDGNK